MGSLVRFFFTKYFWINLIIGLILISAGIYTTMRVIDDYTLHGQSITVPDLTGFKMDELADFMADKNLQDTIIDSIYYENKPKGVVLEQNPPPGFQVKEGRKIYLTISARTVPQLAMPTLADLTSRQAIAKLETYGLVSGDMIFEPSNCSGCVLRAEMNGEELESGEMVNKGSVIDLVLGGGSSDEVIPVPDLSGLTFGEASSLLKSRGLNVGAPVYYGCETEEDTLIHAKVFKQLPTANEESFINLGNQVLLFLSPEEDVPEGDSIDSNETTPEDGL